MNKQLIDKILEAAIRAPSGDNVQPWRLNILNDFTQINLYNLPEQDDSYFNYKQSASHIAHGAVIENIAIASKHLGCEAQIKLFPSQANLDHVAQIDLKLTQPKFDSLYEAIFNRYTNRFPYIPHDVLDEDLKKLFGIAEQVDHTRTYLIHQRKTINKLARALMINDRVVFEHEDMHRFLFDKVRWDSQQIDSTKDGMPVATLGLNSLERLFFPLMRFWWFVTAANFFGLSRIIGLKCLMNCRSASLIGMITIDESNPHGFVQAGRAIQRVWLETTRQGLAFQPLAGLVFLIHRLDEEALDEFSDSQRQEVKNAREKLTKLFGISDKEIMVMGFRIGQGKRLTIKTARKPI